MKHSTILVSRVSVAMMVALGAMLPGSLPVAASCVPLQMLLPTAATADTVVFIGTVLGSDPLRTQLAVDAWYLGGQPSDLAIVVGGRDPLVIASTDWTPSPGERYAVVATRTPDGSILTGTCAQSILSLELIAAMRATYGEPLLPPFMPLPSASPVPCSSPTVPVPTSGQSQAPRTVVLPSPVVTCSDDSSGPGPSAHGTPAP